jgi:lipopolysaccharide exporter
MHNDIHNYGGEARLERALQFVDSIATCSRFLAEDSIYDKCRPFVLPNGCSVELGDFLAPEARSGMTLIGRLVPDKGILEGIEVCRRLNLRGYRMELRIVGKSDDQLRWSVKDSYARSCRHAAARVNAQLGWEAVKLVGHVPHSELLTLLRATAFLLHPCNWDEPFGMAVLEAMAAGAVPVVAATGGLPELVRDGVTGLLLPAGAKPEAYVDRILGASLATRGKLASQARESALSEYQWPVIVERFEGLVYECVGQ